MPHIHVTEQGVYHLLCYFYDINNILIKPISVTWKVLDLETKNELLSPTTFTPTSGVEDLVLTSAINTILQAINKEETRRVIVQASYSPTESIISEYQYDIVNSAYLSGEEL